MKTHNAIPHQHPSFGCGEAAFIFAKLIPGPFGGIEKLILVETKNEWAVQTIERILLIFNNEVNEGYKVMAAFRDCSTIGIRNVELVEIEYIDFMMNIVNHAYIINDPITATVFERSLTDETRNQAIRMLKTEADNITADDIVRSASLKSKVKPVEFNEYPKFEVLGLPKPQPFFDFDLESSKNYQMLMAALMDLGYKKPQIKRVLESFGPEIDNITIENLVKICLQRIAS